MNSRSLHSLFALLLAFALPLALAAASDEEGGSTRALGLRVRLELLEKLGTDSLHVEVQANGGSVALSGKVKERATAELAEEVARKVSGVTSVDNQIKVEGAEGGSKVDHALAEAEHELSDAALETRVRIALVDKLGSDGFRIGTDAASGVLTLEFPRSMASARRKDAIRVAKKVEGVKKVVSLEKD